MNSDTLILMRCYPYAMDYYIKLAQAALVTNAYCPLL
jgi:hypothetical protein